MIVYGHAESNAVWPVLLGKSPVQVRRGKVALGLRDLLGDDLACVFVYPRPDSEAGLIGVVAGTGINGSRLTERLPYFVSGVAYPDCTVFSASRLEQGAAGCAPPASSATTGASIGANSPGGNKQRILKSIMRSAQPRVLANGPGLLAPLYVEFGDVALRRFAQGDYVRR